MTDSCPTCGFDKSKNMETIEKELSLGPLAIFTYYKPYSVCPRCNKTQKTTGVLLN